MERAYLLVSGALFGVVALVHLLRAINGWTFVIGMVDVPVIASWIGFVVAGAVCAWAIRLAAR